MKRFNFEPETLYLIVRILDCFLGKTDVLLDEKTLLSFHMNKEYIPSELAAMAVFLAQTCMELGSSSWSGPQWSETLCITTKYSKKKVEQIAVDFIKEEDTVRDYGLKKTLKRKYKGVVTYQRLLRLALCSLKR